MWCFSNSCKKCNFTIVNIVKQLSLSNWCQILSNCWFSDLTWKTAYILLQFYYKFIIIPKHIINQLFLGKKYCLHTPVYTFSYSQKNNFGSKNQEKYVDPESTSFCHFLTKIRTVLCITKHIRVDSHWSELITFE